MSTLSINQVEGDDNINRLLNTAMHRTVSTLCLAGLLTTEQGEEFVKNHIAVFVAVEGGFAGWVKRFFKKPCDRVVIFKVASETSTKD